MRDSGKVNKICQLQRSRISSSKSTPSNLIFSSSYPQKLSYWGPLTILWSWLREKMRDSGKDNKYNQLPRHLASSTREFQFLPVSSVVSFSVRIWVSRIFPRNWNSRIFSRSQLPRQWCFRGKFLCFPFLDKFCPERQCDFSGVDLR